MKHNDKLEKFKKSKKMHGRDFGFSPSKVHRSKLDKKRSRIARKNEERNYLKEDWI